jgi:transposase
MTRKPYPSDVTDDEWAFIAPYLTLMREDAPQRDYALREVFNRLRWLVRTGAQWRMMPNDLPPWHTVYQQSQRWIAAGVFEDMVHDLRVLLRLAKGKKEQPSAVIFDGRTMHSHRKAVNVQAMMVINAKKAAKFIWQSIRSSIC